MELKARVDWEEALAFLGHRGQKLGDLRERLERAACLCEKELVPRGAYREMDASEALALLPGRDIARHVEGCTRVVLLAVTLGAQSEMLLRRERALSARYGGAPSRSNQIHHGGYRPAFPSEFRPGGRRKHRPYGGDALLHLPRRRYVRPARRRKDLLWQPRVSSP